MAESPSKEIPTQVSTNRTSVSMKQGQSQKTSPVFPTRLLRIFGGIDFLFAWLYLLIFIYVIPPFDPMVKWIAYVVTLSIMAGSVLMWSGGRMGFWSGISIAVFLLLICATLVGLLVASAAYLYGLYGAFGKGATYVTLFAISLVITYVGLLPVFQLSYLVRARRIARSES